MEGLAFNIEWSPQRQGLEDFNLVESSTQGYGVDDERNGVPSTSNPSLRVTLQDFQSPGLLDFGTVVLAENEQGDGNEFMGTIELFNPDRAQPVQVSLDRLSNKHGFSISDEGEVGWQVPGCGSVFIKVRWEPTKAGGVRQSVGFSFLNPNGRRVRVGAYLCGLAKKAVISKRCGRGAKGRLRKQAVKENHSANGVAVPVPAMAAIPPSERPANKGVQKQKRQGLTLAGKLDKFPHTNSRDMLRLEQSERTPSLSSKPSSRIAKDLKSRRVLFDDKWMDKQEQGFKAWLNFVVDPEGAASEQVGPDEDEPEGAVNPLAELARKQRQAALKRAAYSVFASKEMENIAYMIDREIASGGLALRKDRDLFRDLGLRKLVTNLLMHYNGPWLRLGLEIVLGLDQLCPGGRDGPRMARTLRNVVATYFLGDPELEETYRESKKGLFDENPEYKSELRRRSLRRFLMLVLFLDRAKTASVIEHPSCLFTANSPIKSSQDMIVAFSKEFLAGEGNIIRHLQHSCDYTVLHKQSVLDEYDFCVRNLATDLRDGLRLTRAVEFLALGKSRRLSALLRVPAVSRLQKLHNVGVALQELKAQGVDLSSANDGSNTKCDSALAQKYSKVNQELIMPKDIVDGHRRKTLGLLWKMIAKWKLSLMLPTNALEDEVERIRALHGPTASGISLRAISQKEQQEVGHEQTASSKNTMHDVAIVDDSAKRTRLLLLNWCQAVCAHHGVRVSNITTSMATGRALCLLIHHYHPGLLRRQDISCTTVEMCHKRAPASVPSDLDWAPFDVQLCSRAHYVKALSAERANFRLVNECAAALGCVPVLLPEFDSENIPEEKLMMLFLTYLCSRLLASRNEIAAAIKIQRLWTRKTRLQRLSKMGHRAEKAAAAIQHMARAWISKRRADRAELYRLKSAAAVSVQALVRARIACSSFRNQRTATIRLQRWTRASLQRNTETLKRQEAAAVSLQSAFRARVQRQRYVAAQSSCITLQSHVRRQAGRAHFLHLRASAIKVQRVIRGRKVRGYVGVQQASAVVIQSASRRWLCKSVYLQKQRAVIIIQSKFIRRVQALALLRSKRATAAALLKQRQAAAATKIQSVWRMDFVRCLYTNARDLARMLQKLQRGRACRARLARTNQCVLKIQTMWRRKAAGLRMQSEHEAAAKIQAAWRMTSERNTYWAMLGCILEIQCAVRQWQCRSRFLVTQAAVVRVQASMRGWFALHRFKALQRATLKVQTSWRTRVAIERTAVLRAKLVAQSVRRTTAAVKIQATYRCHVEIRAYMARRGAAVTLQSATRRKIGLQKFVVVRSAIIRVQAAWRQRAAALRARDARALLVRARAAVLIQSAWRGLLVRENLAACRDSVVLTQSIIRRHLAMQKLQRKRVAACVLQNFARKHCMKALAQRRAIVKFQAVVRGSQTRKRRSKQMSALYARLRAATNAATARMSLSGRTQSALEWILNSKDLASVLKACNTLEISTAYSKSCADEFLLSDASDVLFKLIRSCNRSEPHVRVLEVALKVLNQVARQDGDNLYVRLFAAESEAILALVDLLQMFRDKQKITGRVIALLGLYCSDSKRVEAHILTDHDIFKRLHSIEQLQRRKVEMAKACSSSRLSAATLKGSVDKSHYQHLRSILAKLDKRERRKDAVKSNKTN